MQTGSLSRQETGFGLLRIEYNSLQGFIYYPSLKKEDIMKKLSLIIASVLLLLLSTACSSSSDNITREFERSATVYSDKLSTDTPEGLAYASSMIYKSLSEENMTVDDALKELEGYSSKDSLEALQKSGDFFKEQISQFIDYLKANDDAIENFEYTKTIYDDSNHSHIERIQNQKSGKKFYFKQDFILEDGQWKISGDNIDDAFKLKSKPLISLFSSNK